MTKYDNNTRVELLSLWRQARSEGQAQKDFCRTHNISARTLRAWLAAEGTPKVSVGRAEVILRRMAKHLLEAAEEIAAGGFDHEGSSASDAPTAEKPESLPQQPLPVPPAEPQVEPPSWAVEEGED